MNQKIKIAIASAIFALGCFFAAGNAYAKVNHPSWWSVQAIDTVKYSRDLAAQFGNDTSFDSIIDAQVSDIAEAGATHVAISTPYDEEFVPFLRRWVKAARKYNLNVWFRGNFSGWEDWFGYDSITRKEHLELLEKFITSNKDLFENGDIFTSCPECENGGPGDPRHDTDVAGFRQFLIDEYKVAKDALRLTGKSVAANYFPMNGDVAKLIMDKATTKALGGVVVIDHYVASPQKLANDIKEIASLSGGKVVLGEFGVPIPDINGEMTEQEQADWIEQAFARLVKLDSLIGLNYWTNVGGSTQIWNRANSPRLAVSVIQKYFIPKTFQGQVVDEAGGKVKGAVLTSNEKSVISDNKGEFKLAFVDENEPITISAEGYFDQTYLAQDSTEAKVVMVKTKEGFFYTIRKFFNQLFSKVF